MSETTLSSLSDISFFTASNSSFSEATDIHMTSTTNTSFTDFILQKAIGHCSVWLPVNHILFQLGNIFIFLSYLAPHGIYGLLYLRSCLLLSAVFIGFWGWIIICALDTLLWNIIFILINLVHIAIILYMLRPIKFSQEIEMIYCELFKPLHVSRHQFKKVLDCMKEIVTLRHSESYCVEKCTRADKLSLVLRGRLLVSQCGRSLHIVGSRQFIDSPEWFGFSSDDCFQITITALEECHLLVWNRDKLKLSISGDQFMQAVFDNILGKDVVKKLLLITESSYNGIFAVDDFLPDTAKLLKKPKDNKTGMDVLLSRRIDRPGSNIWNLGNSDAETTV